MRLHSKILGLAGLVLIVLGGVLWVVRFQFDLYVSITTIAGLFLLLFTLFVNFAAFRDFIGRRSTRYGTGSIVTIVLVLAIIVFVEAISAKHHVRMDMTRNKRYSLSEQTVKILKGLNKDVEALAFYSKGNAQRDTFERVLKQYRYYSPHFRYTMIDPEMDPTVTKEHGVKFYGTTIVKAEGRDVKIEEGTEEKLTNGILRVLRSERKTVYILKGHGEAAVDDEREGGYSKAKDGVQNESYEVKELVLLREEEVPRDAAAVIVNGPKVLPSDHELKLLSNYIGRGGSVLFMIDPDAAPGIEAFLIKYGVILRRDIVVDPMSRMFGADFRMPVVTEYARHPITENFGVASFFPVARSVNVDPAKASKGVKVNVLTATGPKSWAETNLRELKLGRAEFKAGEDTMGPVPMAAVATIGEDQPQDPSKTQRNPVGKMVVFGDSDFANNSYLSASGNRDLFLNSVRWLAGEEDFIAIRPRSSESTPLFLKASQARLIFILPVVVLPVVVLTVGVTIISRRKKNR